MNEEVQFSIDSASESMDKSIVHFVSELMKIRAGRANPQMLSGVMVDYYGSQTPLSQRTNFQTHGYCYISNYILSFSFCNQH